MKTDRKLIAAAAALLPTIALGQINNGVTMYGRIDLSVNHQHYSSTPRTESHNQEFVSSDTSWFGFRGREDLGGGLSAVFKLEHGFQADTGSASSPTQFWVRESYVGLASNTLGSVLLGSQFNPGVWLTLKIDPFRRSNTGSGFPLFQQGVLFGGPLGYDPLINNAVQYVSPEVAGFVVRGMVAASEGVAPGGHPWNAGVEYTADRFYVGAVIERAKVPAGPPTPAWNNTFGQNRTVYQLGATYRFDAVKLHGYYINAKIPGSNGAIIPTVARNLHGGMLGVSVPFGLGEFAASIQKRHVTDAANADAQTLALQYTYFLSKRTYLYAGGARTKNQANASFGVWPSRIDAFPAQPALGADVTGYQMGIRHFF